MSGQAPGCNVSMLSERPEPALVISLDGLDQLILALRRRGYCVVGPSVRDGAIVYEELETASELPIG